MIEPFFFDGLAGSSPETDRIQGVVIGVVTDNKDPDGLGRVKLRLPWLSEKHESHWARVVSPMAGNDRGLYLLPEVEDEVLVAFEHGRIERPFVLGALWNSKDKPPCWNSEHIPEDWDSDDKQANKKNGRNVRVLQSRSGHVIRLDDTDKKERIEIVDAKGKQSIVFDTAAGTITITADQDVVIESKNGMLKLSGEKGVEITAPDGPAKLEAKQNLELKSPGGQVNVKGSTIHLN
jgi:uncharacterized protein involved in type VI secretion and phage assembly